MLHFVCALLCTNKVNIFPISYTYYKVAACLVTNTGSLYPALDKIEQGLDMLQDAITAAGLTPGKDFFIALDLAAHDIFDYVSRSPCYQY